MVLRWAGWAKGISAISVLTEQHPGTIPVESVLSERALGCGAQSSYHVRSSRCLSPALAFQVRRERCRKRPKRFARGPFHLGTGGQMVREQRDSIRLLQASFWERADINVEEEAVSESSL